LLLQDDVTDIVVRKFLFHNVIEFRVSIEPLLQAHGHVSAFHICRSSGFMFYCPLSFQSCDMNLAQVLHSMFHLIEQNNLLFLSIHPPIKPTLNKYLHFQMDPCLVCCFIPPHATLAWRCKYTGGFRRQRTLHLQGWG
jgi:hypothetical protein